MRRAALLTLVALLLAALGVVVLAEIPAKTGMPAVARARLDQYLDSVYPAGGVQVLAAIRARSARRFDAEMSGPVFGGSAYYQTDFGPVWTERDNLLPLPYPPREMWCVLLKDSTAANGSDATRVVFPALHMDIYNADWLVHETSPDRDAGQMLDAVGCALALE
jgi:hypothetical protein